MNITEDYCSYEVAKLLKEKGFNEKCSRWYVTNEPQEGVVIKGFGENQIYINAPTHQMAMKWLRYEKGIAIIPIISSILDNEKFLWNVNITIAKTNETYTQGWAYEDYESIVDDTLKYCLENLI